MWQRLFDGPWPDAHSLLPAPVQRRAATEVRAYWRSRGWQYVFGAGVLWALAVYRGEANPALYALLAAIIALAYLLGMLPSVYLFFVGAVGLFMVQGLAINGLGAVTALWFYVPYTVAAMLLAGQRRVIIQGMCVLFFWVSLVYEVVPFAPQARPSYLILVSYNILLAAFTFQTLRHLNQLAVDINTEHVAEEVRQQSQQFLARVSHELRTPLNSMLGFAKLLRRADLNDSHATYLRHVIDEGEQLNRLVSDLLDSAHLSTGKLTLHLTECDINAICTVVADEHRASIREGVALVTSLEPTLLPLHADPVRLRQLIGNLLANAAKHTEHGGITVRTYRHAATVCIDVADTGPGIDEEQQKLIFVPFVQLDSRRRGVGLGLDIALQLARLHGGDIHLSSTPGEGSTFTVELPLRPKQDIMSQ